MRRIIAVAIAACLLAGPLAATEIDMKKKDEKAEQKKTDAAAKPKTTTKTTMNKNSGKPAPAKGAPANSCADPKAQAAKVPQTGSAGFFQTVEDIYASQRPVSELAKDQPKDPKAAKDAKAEKKEEPKKDEPKKKAD